jgi:hypothetical protein
MGGAAMEELRAECEHWNAGSDRKARLKQRRGARGAPCLR